jgi:ATP-binding cassette subfamily B protein
MSRLTFIPQMERTDCGAACLAMVLGHHGAHVPLPELREACGVSRDGVTAHALADAAHHFGLEVQPSGLTVAALAGSRLPAILHWEFNHFVVLARMKRRGAEIYDPASGRRLVAMDELGRAFTGLALILQPGPTFQPRRREPPGLARYRRYLKSGWSAVCLVLLASIFLHLAGLALPAASQVFLDVVVVPRQESLAWSFAAGFASVSLVKIALSHLRSWVAQRLEYQLDTRLLTEFMEHLLRLPVTFFNQRAPGDLLRRVQDNVSLREFMASRATSVVLDCVLLVGYAALMLGYQTTLAVLVVGLGLLRVAVLSALRRPLRQMAIRSIGASSRESAAMNEALSCPEMTKAFGLESSLVSRVMKETDQRLAVAHDSGRLSLGIGHLGTVLDAIGLAGVIWLGAMKIIDGEMTVGVFSAFLSLRMLFSSPLEHLAGVTSDLQMFLRQLQRMDDVLDTRPERRGGRRLSDFRGGLAFRGVGYRYSTRGRDVLKDISFEVLPGQRVAIVGPSGAGKSTLAKLALGLHRPTEGTILIDGHDLDTVSLEDLRQRVAICPQDPYFFDASILSNVTLGRPGFAHSEIFRILELVCLDELVRSLPEGLHTRLGQGGTRLSGGQRQRLALARALLQQPALLLLDEATSSLDHETEKRVHQALSSLPSAQLIIAHRLMTVVNADRILVIEGGILTEEGDYQALMQRAGPFRRLARAMEPAPC